jgi:hypothetical protein
MSNKENAALQAFNLRIINDLTKKKRNAKSWRGQDDAPHHDVLGMLVAP